MDGSFSDILVAFLGDNLGDDLVIQRGHLNEDGTRLIFPGFNRPSLTISIPDDNTVLHTLNMSIPYGGPIQVSQTVFKRQT
jgi:hypothetical protein